MDQITVKRAPVAPAVATTQTGRYGLVAQAMLQNQQNNLTLFRQRPLGLREAAVALGVSLVTLRKWVNQKYIAAIRVGSRGHWRIRPEEIERVLNENTQGVSHE
jgi:excisionase family DNA binding protein